MQEFLPDMVKRNHGHIVTVASMASFITGVGNTEYAASKAAALAFHEGLAQEIRHVYGARGVRTRYVIRVSFLYTVFVLSQLRSIIHPTYIRTPMTALHQQLGNIPRGNLLEPEPLVDMILAQLFSGNSGQCFFPSSLWVMAGIRGWPAWVQEYVRGTQRAVLGYV